MTGISTAAFTQRQQALYYVKLTCVQVAFMTQAGLDYDQCTADELNEAIQPSGKPLWALLAQVEESKWNQQVALEIKQDPGNRSFFKVQQLSTIFTGS